jgi:outer membrane protein OmpA-like peptidoglycan-associated protein
MCTTHRVGRGSAAAVLGILVIALAGCQLGAQPRAVSSLTMTSPAASSALVVVADSDAGPALSRLVAASARPDEQIDVLGDGAPAPVLVAASAPGPVAVTVSRRPISPGTGATSFQRAEYQRSLDRWQRSVAAAEQAAHSHTRAALAAWSSSLGIEARIGRLPEAGSSASLGRESTTAASAVADLGQAAGGTFGGRRVLLLFPRNLGGTVPPGLLTGDDVIVVTSFAPSAAAASSAQAGLLAAGAGAATVLGPEYTAVQLSQAVSLGLSRPMSTDVLSGPALFANDSSTLGSAATRMLMRLVAPLRKPGASAIISGYASTPGSAQANYLLSYARAAAVAAFLQARGVSATSLQVVGHGATGLVAPGSSGANRRVVVVLEGSARD